MIIIYVVVMIVLIATALYFYMRKKKPSGPYRLADLIFYPSWWLNGGDTAYILEEYPDSIGAKYTLQRFPCLRKGNCNIEGDTIVDTKLLTSIIQKIGRAHV